MYHAVACPADTKASVYLLKRRSDSLINLKQGMDDVSCWAGLTSFSVYVTVWIQQI